MVRQSVRIALLVGTVAAVAAAAPARADQPVGNGCSSQGTRTIYETVCVPETYQTKRVTYKTEQRVEKFTTMKCERYNECVERTVTKNRHVTEWKEVTRNVCVRVPVCEEKTVTRPHYRYVTETKMVTRCVDKGHWECKEEYSHWKAFCNSLSGLCHRHNECDDPCAEQHHRAPVNNCVQRKVWCPNMVQEQCPVTSCRKVCEMRTEVCKVTTYRTEYRPTCQKVCFTRCIPETCVVKENVCRTRMVPCEQTRTVCVCVPCEEMVTCTRMVRRQVAREVPCPVPAPVAPVAPCAPAAPSNNCCESGHNWFGGGGLFRGCCRRQHHDCAPRQDCAPPAPRQDCAPAPRNDCCETGHRSWFGGGRGGCCNLFGGGHGHRNDCCAPAPAPAPRNDCCETGHRNWFGGGRGGCCNLFGGHGHRNDCGGCN